MKYALETLWFGTLSCLVLAIGLHLVLTVTFLDNGWGFWFVAASCAVAVSCGLWAALRLPRGDQSTDLFFILASSALIMIAILSTSPHAAAIGAGAMLLPVVFVGVPLGMSAARALKSEFRPLIGRDFLAGAIAGMIGVGLALALLIPLGRHLWSPLVPPAEIVRKSFPGLALSDDPSLEVARINEQLRITQLIIAQRRGEKPPANIKTTEAATLENTSPSWLSRLVQSWPVQAVHLFTLVAWDTAILGLVGLLTMALARPALLRLGVLQY
jgi:hypothetical protein